MLHTRPRRTGRFFRPVALIAAAALVLAGCGNRNSEDALRAPLADSGSPASGAGGPAGVPGDVANPAPGTGDAAVTEASTASPETVVSGTAGAAAPAAPGSKTSPAGKTAAAGKPGTAPQAAAGQPGQPTPAPGSAGGQAGAAPTLPGAPPKPGGPGPATPGGPLRIGMNSTLSGPVGAVFVSGVKAVQAWVAQTNAGGGLNGHPVELFIADDGGDPARHRANSQTLVEQKKVVAFVFEEAPISGHGSVSYLQQKRIPVIGSVGCQPWMSRNSMYFPQITSDPLCAELNAYAAAAVALPQNKKKLAILICAEIEGCQNMGRESAYTSAGFQVVYKANISLAQPDFTAQCLGARNAGAEVIALAMEAQSISRTADSCASIGYHPIFANPSHITTDDHLKNPNLDGNVVAYTNPPYFNTTHPEIAAMRQTINKYAPGTSIAGPAAMGWSSVRLLEKAARNLSAPTSEGILEGLWSIRDDDLNGLTAPLTFVKGAKNNGETMQLCFWLVENQKGKWAELDGGKRHCDKWDRKLLGS